MDLWVSVNPVADTFERFIFTDPEGERRLLAFMTLLRNEAHVGRFVLSFDDQPTTLRELFRHLSATARAPPPLTSSSPGGSPRDCRPASRSGCARRSTATRTWATAPGPTGNRSSRGFPPFPRRSASSGRARRCLSPTITRADIEATRARLGGRPLLLYDNPLVEEYDEPDALGIVLAPPRGRDPGLRDVVAA
jgi:hypothetical protein